MWFPVREDNQQLNEWTLFSINEIDSDWLLYIHLILIIKLCSYLHWIVDSCWFAIDNYLLFIVTEHILSFWQYIVHHKSLGISALPAL